MTDRLARLLDLKGFGAILFDEHFTVLRMNPAAEAMLGLSGAFRSHGSLLDLFPELVGVEVQIAAIVAGQDTDYRLEHVNRESGPGQVRYLNLWLLPEPAPGIPEGMKIGYDLDEDAKRFTVTGSGIVVVPRWIKL